MTESFATTLRLAVISAETDALALHTVGTDIRTALHLVEDDAYVDLWEADLDKRQFTALVGYLARATGLVSVGAILLDAGARDEAWALLAAAARTVDAMLDIHHDTDPMGVAENCHLDLHHHAATNTASNSVPITMTESINGPLATATTLASIRLQRTPEVFLDETDLDARYTPGPLRQCGVG
ncbi:hypothetical protein ACTHRK_18250 [Dietzia cercidiphylli]|uniref:hypothetical protein n=1 Tax=Dietzia cercidiphylli TaxID=498199 RepID=UPI003F7DF851